MPVSETRIAARDKQGVEVYYQHSTIPTAENLAAYERHCPGAAGIMLQMAQDDQKEQWRLSHSESTKRFIMRLAGLWHCRRDLPLACYLRNVSHRTRIPNHGVCVRSPVACDVDWIHRERKILKVNPTPHSGYVDELA